MEHMKLGYTSLNLASSSTILVFFNYLQTFLILLVSSAWLTSI